jgi:8-oxo-dGTP diphosphatase
MIRYLLNKILDFCEFIVRWFVTTLANYLPVKVIKDDNDVPFLYRYHLFALANDGPGVCIHHFVKSEPDRGYHDHPWKRSLSFILCGGYDERIVQKHIDTNTDVDTDTDADTDTDTDTDVGTDSGDNSQKDVETKQKKIPEYVTHRRNRFTFNYLDGANIYHRVMIDPGKDVWTLFFFPKRTKTWGMLSLKGNLKPMSTQISDQDGGWWNYVMKGIGLHKRLKHNGEIVTTVDSIIASENKVLLIKRGKNPYKDQWAFPGGRVEASDYDLISAAKRELQEETGLTNIDLQLFHVVGNSTRDPRGFCVTIVYIAQLDKIPKNVRAGDDAVDYNWFDLNTLPNMAFDHKYLLDIFIDETQKS